MAIKSFAVGGNSGVPITGLDKVFVLHNVIDFGDGDHTHADGDVLEVLNVPAGVLVLRAGHKVVAAEGGTAAGTLGDGADPDGFVAASNLNATAGTTQISALALTTGTPNTVTGYSAGKFYAEADTIDYVATNALDAAVVDFFAVCVDLNA